MSFKVTGWKFVLGRPRLVEEKDFENLNDAENFRMQLKDKCSCAFITPQTVSEESELRNFEKSKTSDSERELSEISRCFNTKL